MSRNRSRKMASVHDRLSKYSSDISDESESDSEFEQPPPSRRKGRIPPKPKSVSKKVKASPCSVRGTERHAVIQKETVKSDSQSSVESVVDSLEKEEVVDRRAADPVSDEDIDDTKTEPSKTETGRKPPVVKDDSGSEFEGDGESESESDIMSEEEKHSEEEDEEDRKRASKSKNKTSAAAAAKKVRSKVGASVAPKITSGSSSSIVSSGGGKPRALGGASRRARPANSEHFSSSKCITYASTSGAARTRVRVGLSRRSKVTPLHPS